MPHSHLRRLSQVWAKNPVFFITVCTSNRRSILANDEVHQILKLEWTNLRVQHGWAVGRYVIMPDHVHFFIAPELRDAKRLQTVIGRWKEWTAKQLVREIGLVAPIWQSEFFDHLFRSDESREQKWTYVRENPVRAGLVADANAWPFAGSIDFE